MAKGFKDKGGKFRPTGRSQAQIIFDKHVQDEIKIGLKNRTNPSDIESITERLQFGVGLDNESIKFHVLKNKEATKTLLRNDPKGFASLGKGLFK